jgi:hypothetical protein
MNTRRLADLSDAERADKHSNGHINVISTSSLVTMILLAT